MLIIDIEIKDRNGLKEFFRKLHNKCEDIFFSVIQKIPERFIPNSVMNWIDRYTDKRINQLKQEQIKAMWQKLHLENALDEISKNER